MKLAKRRNRCAADLRRSGGELRYVEGFRDREAVEPSDGGSRGRYPGALSENQLGISDALEFDTMEAAFASMLAGNAILFVDHYDRAVKIGSKGYPNLGVQKAESEKVLRGSNEGFSDSVKTNTALVRKRLRTTDLKVEEIHFGARSDTVLALVYEKELIYPKFLEEGKTADCRLGGWTAFF